MNANIGIPDLHLREVATKLNKVLANETVLYIKTRNYHWNVEGHTFGEMHKFYEAQFEELDEIIDNTAERIRALGHYAEGRLKDSNGQLIIKNIIDLAQHSPHKGSAQAIWFDSPIKIHYQLVNSVWGKNTSYCNKNLW